MNFFYEEYYLSADTLKLTNHRKAFALGCFSDLCIFMGLAKKLAYEEVEHYFVLRSYKKNTLLISDTQPSDRFFYIVEGVTRSYVKKYDEQITQLVLTEGNINTNIATLTSTLVEKAYLVTIEDCLMLEITYEDFERLQQKVPGISLIFSKAMTSYLRFQQTFSDIMKAGSRQKFEFLLNRMPQLLNRCPLKYQAAFLGMKPETLSRIRNEIRFT